MALRNAKLTLTRTKTNELLNSLTYYSLAKNYLINNTTRLLYKRKYKILYVTEKMSSVDVHVTFVT